MRTTKPKGNKGSTEPTQKQKKAGKPEIPQEVLKEFIGKVQYLMQITASYIHNDRFRINVWTEEHPDGSVVSTIKIAKSYFVHYHKGIIIDETIQPKPKKRGFFDD